MKKTLKRTTVFLLLGILVMNCICVVPMGVKAYEIPKKKNFKPDVEAAKIESAVNGASYINAVAENGVITIDGETVAKMNENAIARMQNYEQKLNKNGMYLNRSLANTVSVKVKNVDISDFVEIAIDSENLEKMLNVTNLRIVLKNNNEYIVLNKESINIIKESYGQFKMQIKRLSDTYSVRFMDAGANILEKYMADVKIAMPAQNRNQTVYLYANNQQENWGGQYNPMYRTMEIMTKFTGEYNVASSTIQINDIDSLTEYEKDAINFMVVRGYFTLNGKKFNPSQTLTRYSFAESLVRMFFAIDNDVKCSFKDVNNKYYRYVAASEALNIVEGFDDGTFKGNEAVTVEQVLAIAARTIHQENGYTYPELLGKYINFPSDNPISEWAKKEVALAVREGLYSVDMNLKFAEKITRKDAAVVLYRLFMIMNNTPEAAEYTEFESDADIYKDTIWNFQTAIIVIIVTVAVNLVVLITCLVLVKRKRKH